MCLNTKEEYPSPSQKAETSGDTKSSASSLSNLNDREGENNAVYVESNNKKHNTGGTSTGKNILTLIMCAGGICTSYLCYGLVLEQLTRSDLLKNSGPVSTFIVLSQSVTNSILAWTMKNFFSSSTSTDTVASAGNKEKKELDKKLFFGIAFCFFAAMTATNESLNYASYPTVTLVKSTKLIPTMVMGVLIEKNRYSKSEWIGVLLITSGIVLFNFSRLSSTSSSSNDNNNIKKEDTPFGLMLLLFSLCVDGVMGSCQGMLKQSKMPSEKYRIPTSIEMMQYTNLYSIIFLLPTTIITGQFQNAMSVLLPYNDETDTSAVQEQGIVGYSLIHYLLILNTCAALGQISINYTVFTFSPLVCTTITTIRKFFSILLSVAKFGHVFNVLQWSSILMVFSGLYLEIVSKVRHKKQDYAHKKVD